MGRFRTFDGQDSVDYDEDDPSEFDGDVDDSMPFESHEAARAARRSAPWSQRFADIEGMIGLIFAAFVMLCGVGVVGLMQLLSALFYDLGHLSPAAKVGASAAWLVAATLELLSVRWIGPRLDVARHPRPVWIAAQQVMWPWPVRLGAAVWWLAHGVLVVFVADWIVAQYGFVNPTTAERVIAISAKLAVLFAGAYVSVCFLLFALAALFGPRRQLLDWVWTCRVLIDLGITFALVTLREHPIPL